MIKELSRLLDGSYFVERDTDSFYGSRLELIVFLADTCNYSDTEIDTVMQVLDSLEPVNLLANRQGYC